MTETITNRGNKNFAALFRLRKKSLRYHEKKFIGEGKKIIVEGLNFSFPPEKAFYTPRFLEEEKNFIKKLEKKKIDCYRISQELMELISSLSKPQGIVATFTFLDQDFSHLIKKDFSSFLIVHQLQDPGNVGTLIRSADAFGVEAVIITEKTADLYSPVTVQANLGSIFHLPIAIEPDLKKVISELSKRNVKFFRPVTVEKLSNQEVDFSFPIAIIVSSENADLKLFIEIKEIKIPVFGKEKKINPGVLGSIVLFEVAKKFFLEGKDSG